MNQFARFVLLLSLCSTIMIVASSRSTLGEEPSSLARQFEGVAFDHLAQASGYSEGPTWIDGQVFFCSGALLRVDKEGRLEKYLDISPAGSVRTAAGHLLLCDNKHKAILRLTLDGDLHVVADQCNGKPLRSVNDLTLDARGNIYWTDPAGSSVEKPIGNVFRVTPRGVVSRIGSGLAFPNGIEVDPSSRYLYVIESRSKKILRYPLPAEDRSLEKPAEFYDLGGSGGDGCAFDTKGNLWVADFQRPETKQGRITVISPQGKRVAHIDVPAKVVSNLAFGGQNNDEIFCTTAGPPGVFHAKVGVRGFSGHPGGERKLVKALPIAVNQPASRVFPRRFGYPGGPGKTRGWYIWKGWDAKTGQAKVMHEGRKELYNVRVLPWTGTYRNLVYGPSPNILLLGERFNPSFDADDKQRRAYLTSFQDEMCQMKGHGHIWKIRSVGDMPGQFTAQVMAHGKPFEKDVHSFEMDTDCRKWRGGKLQPELKLAAGDQVYMRWVYTEGYRRVVHLIADDASLEVIKADQQKQTDARIATEGMFGYLDKVEVVEGVDGKKLHGLIFASYWSSANRLQPGTRIRLQLKDAPAGSPTLETTLISRKNLGTYGSGVTRAELNWENPQADQVLDTWLDHRMVRFVVVPTAM